jgi:DNA-binding transcriptional LysR family regulator
MELEQLLGAAARPRDAARQRDDARLAYYESGLDILARVEETEMQVSRQHDEPRGVLQINASVTFGALYLGRLVAKFMEAYLDLKTELTLNDRFIDPIEERGDVIVRIGVLGDSSVTLAAWRQRTACLTGAPVD